MKTRILSSVALIAVASAARAVTMIASFDAATFASKISNPYQENGITFSDTNGIGIWPMSQNYSWFWAQDLGAIYGRTITISTGDLMNSVKLYVGNNWSDFMIASGAIHPQFRWETWLNGQETGSGAFSGPGKGQNFTVADQLGFDSLIVSTWDATFGQGLLGLGQVTVTAADQIFAKSQQVANLTPEGGSTAALFGLALLGIFSVRAFSHRLSWS